MSIIVLTMPCLASLSIAYDTAHCKDSRSSHMLRPVWPRSMAQTRTVSVLVGSTQAGTFGISNQTGWLSGTSGRAVRAVVFGLALALALVSDLTTASAERNSSWSSAGSGVTAGAETGVSPTSADSAGATSVVDEAAALPDEADESPVAPAAVDTAVCAVLLK